MKNPAPEPTPAVAGTAPPPSTGFALIEALLAEAPGKVNPRVEAWVAAAHAQLASWLADTQPERRRIETRQVLAAYDKAAELLRYLRGES